MATLRAVDGTIEVKADHESGVVILIVRDDTGREVEISLTPKASSVLRLDLSGRELEADGIDTVEYGE